MGQTDRQTKQAKEKKTNTHNKNQNNNQNEKAPQVKCINVGFATLLHASSASDISAVRGVGSDRDALMMQWLLHYRTIGKAITKRQTQHHKAANRETSHKSNKAHSRNPGSPQPRARRSLGATVQTTSGMLSNDSSRNADAQHEKP